MSNIDINVDRRTDGRKIGRLYRTLLQAGAIKRCKESRNLGDLQWFCLFFTVRVSARLTFYLLADSRVGVIFP